MGPVIFQTLPAIFSFATVTVLLQICILLLCTGKRYLRQASFFAAGIAGAFIGEGASLLTFPAASWLAICGGLVGGVLLCYYLRPAGVGVALAFLAFYGSSYLVNLEYIQYVAALVLFAYGLLLTDLAPTFVASLLASAILLISGIWSGVPAPILLSVVSAVAAARVLIAVVPQRLVTRDHSTSGRTPYR
jgi:hypothetical protein